MVLGNAVNYGSEQFFMYSMIVTECFHNKCFKLSTLGSVYIPWGCESNMILSVMTEPKKVQVKSCPKEKHLQVSIETLTLKPVLLVEVSHPQPARRGRGFRPGGGKRVWTGKTSDNSENETKATLSYNELEAAQSLVGMKEPQPKLGSICKLRSYDTKQTTESKDIVEIKPQQQVKPKLKCQGRIKIKKEIETDIKKNDVVQEKPDHKMEETAEKPEVSEATLHEEVQTLITEGKGDVEIRSHIDTLCCKPW